MSNEQTKLQIKSFMDKAIEKFKNPDRREILKAERQKRAKKVLKDYGL